MPDDAAPIKRLFAELDYPVAEGRRIDILMAAVDALEPLYALLLDGGGTHSAKGERGFAMFHLAARSLSDLVASAHLASHGYLQQAYTTMRPVLENGDLMELFAREPDEAALWVNDPKPGKTYSPRNVRAKVEAGEDALAEYGHLSEMGSHPRFRGARLTGLMRVPKDDPTDRTAVLRIGPFYPEHPATIHVYLWQFQLTIRLGFKFRHLRQVSDRITREQWVARYLETAKAAARGLDAVRAALVEMGEPDDEETRALPRIFEPLISGLEAGGPKDS